MALCGYLVLDHRQSCTVFQDQAGPPEMFELQTEFEFSYFTLSHCDLHECAASSMPSLQVILIRIDGAD